MIPWIYRILKKFYRNDQGGSEMKGLHSRLILPVGSLKLKNMILILLFLSSCATMREIGYGNSNERCMIYARIEKAHLDQAGVWNKIVLVRYQDKEGKRSGHAVLIYEVGGRIWFKDEAESYMTTMTPADLNLKALGMAAVAMLNVVKAERGLAVRKVFENAQIVAE
jgi:hypothetical protein